MRITTSAAKVGLRPAATYALADLWTNTARMTGGSISAVVPAHSAVLYGVTPR
jgi:alpha-galactosidase